MSDTFVGVDVAKAEFVVAARPVGVGWTATNDPEGIAATTGLRAGGWTVRNIYLLWGGIALASALSACFGFALLDGASPKTIAFMFAFAGGAILTMLATSMMPEAYEHAGKAVGFMTVFGFAVALAIDWLDKG